MRANKDIIICVDLNARLPQLDPFKAIPRGRILQKYLEDNNLICISDGTPTRIHHNDSTSIIDLTLTNPKLATKTSCRVLNDNFGSDHQPTFSEIGVRPVYEPPAKPNLNFRKADWPLYREAVLKNLNTILPHQSLEENVALFTEILNLAVKISVPAKKTPSLSLPVPYWTEECRSAIKERNKARNRWKTYWGEENRSLYLKKKAAVQKCIRKAKRDHWQDYCSSLDARTTTWDLWNTVKAIQSTNKKERTAPAIHSDDGSPLTDKDKANIFAAFFSESSNDNNLSATFANHKKSFTTQEFPTPDHEPDPVSNLITISEIKTALRKSGNTASGPDGISYEMLRQLPPQVFQTLADIFNQSWLTGKLPRSWKTATVIPVHKKDKPANRTSSYRPISLTSVICKTLERIIDSHQP